MIELSEPAYIDYKKRTSELAILTFDNYRYWKLIDHANEHKPTSCHHRGRPRRKTDRPRYRMELITDNACQA